MKTRMFLKNISSWRSIAFAFIIVLSAVVVPLSGLISPSVSAQTASEKSECYTKFNGKEIILNRLSDADKKLYATCRQSDWCQDKGPGIKDRILGRMIACNNPYSIDPGTTQAAAEAEIAPLILLRCNVYPNIAQGDVILQQYLACAETTKNIYNSCDNTGGGVTGNAQDTSPNTAKCIYDKLPAPKPLLAQILAAVTEGRNESQGIIDQVIKDRQQAEEKSKCEGDGGTWENNKCTPKDDTPERTCVIDGLGWILCPAINLMGNLVDGAYFLVSGLLKVQPLVVTGGGAGIYDAWSIMRNFANVAFVIAFLVIIFSQMTSVGVSNYGIKKMLPRLIIAAILVNVSFWLCAIAVDLSNISGASINDLFKGISKSLVKPCFDADPTACLGSPWDTGSNTWSKIASAFVIGGLGIGVALYVTLSALLPALVIALFAILTVFLVLTLRQALIILLIVVAPLAFVAYLLPNTESLFKKWRDLFQTLLLMYPIIGLIFGASSLASTIVMTSAANGDANLKIPIQIMGALISIVPLAITPIVMRAAGGLLNRFGGIVNNPNKGPKDRLMKAAQGRRDYRQNIAKTRRIDRAAGERGLGRVANSMGPEDSKRRRTARWFAGAGVMAGVNKDRSYKNAEDVQKSKEQSQVAKRALVDDKYAKHITAPTGSADMTKAYAIEATHSEQKKDTAAAKLIFEHEGASHTELMARIRSGEFDADSSKKHAAMQRYFEIANSEGVQEMIDHLGELGTTNGDSHDVQEFQKAAAAVLETHKLKPVDFSGTNMSELKNGKFTASEGARIEKTISDGKVQASHVAKMDVDEMRRWNQQLADNEGLLDTVGTEQIESTYNAILQAEKDPRLNVNFGDRERKALEELKLRLVASGLRPRTTPPAAGP